MKSLRQARRAEPVALLLLLTALGAVAAAFGGGISGNDFWWHIKVGEYVARNHRVPTTDIFSWIGMEKGIAWTAHEWLADLLFYLLYSGLGELGVYVSSLLSALALTLLLWGQARPWMDRDLPLGGLFFALFGVVSSLFCYGRPHLFSFFLLFWELKLLYAFYEDPSRRGIWLIPLIAALWSNLHGGSSNLSYILCLAFLLVGLCRCRLGRLEAEPLPRPALLRLGAVSLGAVLGILVNPVGLRVLVYPYASFADGLSMGFISEWAPPDAKLWGNLLLYFLPIGLLALGMLAAQGSVRLLDAAMMGLFLLLFFRSARFIMLWYIGAVFFAFPYLLPLRVKPVTGRGERLLLRVCTLLLPLALTAYGLRGAWEAGRSGSLITKAMDDQAVAYVREQAPKRLFNDYNLGETLIYNELPVFFDARADLFAQAHIMADGVSLMLLEQLNPEAQVPYVDVDALTEAYGFDAFLVLKTRPLYSWLMSHPEGYSLRYEDEKLGYFAVTNP